jgi:hypothetical protein
MDFRATLGATASQRDPFARRRLDRGRRRDDGQRRWNARGFHRVAFEVKTRVWPRCVDRLGAHWPHVAALVAQHSLTIFKDHRGSRVAGISTP